MTESKGKEVFVDRREYTGPILSLIHIYVNNNEIMSISTLALLVSPELKISDKGMFDVKTQNPVPLIERTWTGEENESQNA